MPRMPRPEYNNSTSNNSQNTAFFPKSSLANTNNNIKIVLLEDTLRKELVPKNILTLDETLKIPKDSYVYIFDNDTKTLKRIASNTINDTLMGQVGQKIEVENILGYSFVSELPSKEKAQVNTVYIVPTEGRSGTYNMYDEYLFIKEKNEFEKLGNVNTDLSEYRPREEQDLIDQALKDLLLTKIDEQSEEINTRINDLDSDIQGIPAADSTFTAVKQVDGQLIATINKIQIAQEQVNGLPAALNNKVNVNGTDRLMTISEGNQLATLVNLQPAEKGAQVNKIECLKTQDGILPITDSKVVAIPTAMINKLGLVKGSNDENKISVATDGTMEINSLNVNKLVQTTEEELVLTSGDSTSTKKA